MTTELPTTEGCLLWQEARDKAMEKGFQMSLTCPLEEVCNGKHCTFTEAREKLNKYVKENGTISN